MKKLFLTTGAFLLIIGFSACNKKKSTDLSADEKRLTDSLDQKYKPDELAYVYFDSIPVYKDKTEKELIGYIPFCNKVYVDTILNPIVDKENIYYVGFTYVRFGKLMSGVSRRDNFANQVAMSGMEPGLMFMSNFIDPTEYYCSVEIKAVKDKKVLGSFIPDDSVHIGYDLYTYVIDSVKLDEAGEIIFLNTNYPACGHASDAWYLAYKNNRFSILTHAVDWADAPYWDGTDIYLPFQTNNGVVMACWSQYYTESNCLVTDSAGKVITYQLPDEYSKDIGLMIYKESHHSAEVLDKNGKPILDEYDEPALRNEVYEKRWLKWDGEKMVEIKIDTTIVQLPE